jgi:hypothetical protein
VNAPPAVVRSSNVCPFPAPTYAMSGFFTPASIPPYAIAVTRPTYPIGAYSFPVAAGSSAPSPSSSRPLLFRFAIPPSDTTV